MKKLILIMAALMLSSCSTVQKVGRGMACGWNGGCYDASVTCTQVDEKTVRCE